MDLYVGTSGYSYKEWKGTFYPEDLPQHEMLRFYAQIFRAVEINNTFHRMPRASVLNKWRAEVPSDFRFVLKAPQRITHFQRLKNTGESLAYLLKAAGALGDQLGPILFQLPPAFEKNAPRLDDFLKLFPSDYRVAFEFRHPSWFDEEVFQLLIEHRAALCIADAVNDLEIPLIATTDWGYLRLRRPDYGKPELMRWAAWVRSQKWREVFVFFKHEDAAKGPQFASTFLELATTPTTSSSAEHVNDKESSRAGLL